MHWIPSHVPGVVNGPSRQQGLECDPVVGPSEPEQVVKTTWDWSLSSSEKLKKPGWSDDNTNG